MYRILICDDEIDIVSTLRVYLTDEGYLVREAYSGAEALEILRTEEIHLVLLDIMMPDRNGLEIITEIRRTSNVPVILVSARSEEQDKVRGLNLGADDYVTKPFTHGEVVARVNSQIRRYMRLGGGAGLSKLIRIGGVTLDDNAKTVTVDGSTVSLTPLEYSILCLLMKNAGTVFTPKEIYRIVWNEAPMGAENAVAVHIRHIRQKIEADPANPRYLKVVWGKGYKFQAE